MLGRPELVSREPSRKFLLTQTQHMIGGFAKVPGGPPDPYHSYLGLAALATIEDPALKPFDASLCVSSETVSKIEKARKGLLVAQQSAKDAKDRDAFWADKQATWPEVKFDPAVKAAVLEA
jgi:geranylgeranyl transferase type-1 subunit beta